MLRLDSEFFRRAVCVVVPFLWLLVHGLCLAFGAVECHPNGDGTWTCSGEGSSYQPTIVTNVVGVCTNCVAMSPSECEIYKSSIILYTTNIQNSVAYLGSSFYTLYSKIVELDVSLSSGQDYLRYLIIESVEPWASSIIDELVGQTRDIRSAANQYETELMNALESLSYNVLSIKSQVNTIDCSSCTASFDEGGGGSGSGGGGGGGTVSGGSCTNCVCKEQLEAILKVLKGKTTIVEDETREVESIASTVDRIKTSFNAFRKYMKDIFEGHTHITITDGNWTNVYLTGHASGFDYNKSNVLERIELLLWSLTSLNTPSNTTSYLDGKEINGVGDAIDEGLDSLKSDIVYATNNIAGFHSSLVRLVSALQPIGSSDGGFSRTFLGHTEFELGDTHFDVPDLVADYDNLSDAQGFFDALRLSFQVLYLAGSAYCIWVFWAFALNKTLVFVKWAGEIMTAFFG